MKSTVTFKEYFDLFAEMASAGVTGGSGGFSPDNPNSSDSYGTNDNRNYTPSGPPVIQRRKPINTIIKVGKKRKPKRRKYKK
jgi:hypothetical protein